MYNIIYIEISMSIDNEHRTIGKAALKSVLSIQKNIDIIEKNIFQKSTSLDQYQDFCMTVVSKIKQGDKLGSILTHIKNNNMGFESDYFKPVRDTLDEQQSFIENPFEVDEGVMECKCGSRKTISFSKQIRSGDEGTTVFAKCVDCGATWKT